MKKKLKTFFIFILIISFGIYFETAFPVLAKQKQKQEKKQEKKQTAKLKLGLKEVVNYTVNESFDINIAKTRIDQAQGYYYQSFSSLFPSISGQFSGERFQGGEVILGSKPIDLDRTTYRPAISTDFEINTGGKLFFDIKSSKNQLKKIKSAHDSASQQALLDACSAYFNWLREYSSLKVVKESLKEANEQLKLNESRLKTGFGTKLDVMQTKSMLSERKNSILEIQSQKNISKINLATLLNIPFDIKILPENPYITPITFVEDNLTLEELLRTALINRPDLKELTFSIKQAKALLSSAVADLFPTLTLNGYVRGIGPELDELQSTTQGSFGVYVNLLKNLGVNNASNIKIARSKIKEAVLQKEKKLNQIHQSIAEVYSNCKLYRQKLRVSLEKIDSTQEEYRITLARLKTGIGINLEVIKAQTDLAEARLAYQTSARDYNIAQLKLLYETGQLTPEKIFKGIEGEKSL
ncbi:MAG: TolC family protein [bacterium]